MPDQPVVAPAQPQPGIPAASAGRGRARIWGIATAIALLQVLLVMLFAWPASRTAPHELPIALAGPPQQVAGIAASIQAARPGAFDVITVADDAAARDAVTSRDAYGALVLASTGATLYTAPAASTAVANALAQGIPAVVAQANPQAQVTVTPLVPNPAGDPNGQGLPISLIPLAITSIAAGAAIGLRARTRSSRLVGVLLYAVLAGALSTWALQGELGVLTGSAVANAGVMMLLCAAVAAATAGLASLLGVAGVGLAAILVFFLGLPFSGAMSAWQLIPTPWGQWAQYLPIGAGNIAVRSVAFFSGAGAAGALTVLACWALAGLALAALVRPRGRHALPGGVPAPGQVM